MRRWLVCGGFFGKPEALEYLKHLAREHRPDSLLVTGGIMTPSADPHQKERFSYLQQFFKELGSLNVHAAVIPGPDDVPLHEFFGFATDGEVDFPSVHIAHATPVIEGDVVILGLGGKLTQLEDATAPRLLHSKNAAEYYLRALLSADQSRKVLLLSEPPAGPLGGPAGNPIVGDLVDSFHPDLCAVLGPTSHRGTQRIAHTLVVNPGYFCDGSAALVDWSKPAEQQVSFLDVPRPQLVT
jgi:hypothetical protein